MTTLIPPSESSQPSILETIYKDDLVSPISDLKNNLNNLLVADNPSSDEFHRHQLESFTKSLFDPTRPIGIIIGGDAYIIEQLPPEIAMDSTNAGIAALMFAQDFFKTDQAKKLIGNETQCQGAANLIDDVLAGIKKEPGIFDSVVSNMATIQQHLEAAQKGNYLHLPTKAAVEAQLAQLKG